MTLILETISIIPQLLNSHGDRPQQGPAHPQPAGFQDPLCDLERHQRAAGRVHSGLEEWKGWNSFRGSRDDFNRPLIFSLIRYYHQKDMWLFGGVFEVLERRPDRYVVRLSRTQQEFVGRLLITRVEMEGFCVRLDREAFRSPALEATLEEFYP
jgi:hypothetical protein